MNLYFYCHNNPLRYIGPSGHTAEVVLAEEMGSAYDEGIVPVEAINSLDIEIETSSNIDCASIQAQCSDDQVISKDIFDESIEAISEIVGEYKEAWDKINSPIGRFVCSFTISNCACFCSFRSVSKWSN